MDFCSMRSPLPPAFRQVILLTGSSGSSDSALSTALGYLRNSKPRSHGPWERAKGVMLKRVLAEIYSDFTNKPTRRLWSLCGRTPNDCGRGPTSTSRICNCLTITNDILLPDKENFYSHVFVAIRKGFSGNSGFGECCSNFLQVSNRGR